MRYARRVRFLTLALVLLALTPGCRRHRARAHGPAPIDASVSADVAPTIDAGPLDDRCKRHDDCAKVDLFVDGPLRCCLACGAQAASSKSAADEFIAACAKDKEQRECPIYDCKAPLMDAVCVGGHCMLRPRP